MASWHTSLFDDVKSSPEGTTSESTGPSGPQSTAGGQGDSGERQHIRLACQACQRKKIKCDRFFPCGQCTRSNLSCVASTRKPRARHTGKRNLDSELRGRIAKLENLVESLSGEVAAGSGQTASPDKDEEAAEQVREQPARKSSTAIEKYVGREFWSSLTNEFQALRDALEEDQDEGEEDETTPSTSTSAPSSSAEYDLLICPPGAVYVMPGALHEPNAKLSDNLCNIFCSNVDDLFKTFHQPTLRNLMINGAPYLGQEPNTPANKTVKAAVWFSAVNTLSEGECQTLLGLSRPDALQQYKRIVDVALAQADLMNTTDLATLQAFATYLAASRLTDPGRRMWTLMAVAVRIAKAMGLHREGIPRSPYMTEIRRRLFHQIRFLDAYCCIDRGSEGLVTPGSFDTLHPKNVNDAEFDENSTFIPSHEKVLTDQSFALMAYAATEKTHLLFIAEDKSGATWQQRLEMAEQFERDINDKYLGLCDKSIPFQRMMIHVGSGIISSMKLRAVRPVQRHTSSTPPRVDSPFVFQLAINTLLSSEAILTDPDGSQWRWMIWVPWHGLAVTLAGLCSIRDTPLATKAWQAVEASYARNLRFVAEGRHGMLWRPIEKLYRKASAFRDHRENEPTSTTASPPPAAAKGQQQPLPQMGTANPVTSTSDAPTSANLFDEVSPTTAQAQQQLNHNNLPHGAMPTSGVNMDFDFCDIDLSPSTLSSTVRSGGPPNTAINPSSNNNVNPAPTMANDLDMTNFMDMPLDNNNNMMDLDMRNGDISWMDFERILEDMNAPPPASGAEEGGYGGAGGGADGVNLGDVQWPANVPKDGGSWGCNLHGDLM